MYTMYVKLTVGLTLGGYREEKGQEQSFADVLQIGVVKNFAVFTGL